MKVKTSKLAMTAFVLPILFAGCTSVNKTNLNGSMASADLNLLQGKWAPVEAEFAGLPYPEEARKSIKMEIHQNEYLVLVENNPDKGLIKLYPEENPKRMEIMGAEGPNKGRIIPAIYDISGNLINICYNLNGKGYPVEFKTSKGSQLFLVKYEKVKD